jgi:glycosyltransferase 2 family protein
MERHQMVETRDSLSSEHPAPIADDSIHTKSGLIRTWFGILISILFLVLIFRSIDAHELATTLANVTIWPLFPAIAVYFVGVYFRTIRWQLLLSPLTTISPFLSFRVISIGYMANNVFPLRAGEVYRAHLIGQSKSISRTAVFSTIVLERVFDGLTMLIFLTVIVTGSTVPFSPPLTTVAFFSSIFFGGLLLVSLILVFSPRWFLRIVEIILRFLPEKAATSIRGIILAALSGLESLRGWWSVSKVLLLSILAWLSESMMYYFLFISLSLPVGFSGALLLVAIVNLGIMIPSSPGYVGTFEYFCMQTLAVFKVDPTLALSYAVLLHFALFLPITVTGWILMILTPEAKNALQREQTPA